jgi:hypothetical protein
MSETAQSLDTFEYEKDDVFHGMGGDYWIVTARLWNFDAAEYDRMRPTGERYETTRDYHRREYEIAKLDPAAMGGDTRRVNEEELASYFSGATKAEAREHYETKHAEDDRAV